MKIFSVDMLQWNTVVTDMLPNVIDKETQEDQRAKHFENSYNYCECCIDFHVISRNVNTKIKAAALFFPSKVVDL